MRTFLLLGYRVVLVVALVSFFSFAALDKPVLRSLYVSIDSTFDAFANNFQFFMNFFEPTEQLIQVARAYVRSMILLLAAVVLGSVLGLVIGIIGGIRPGSRLAGVASWMSFAGVLTPSFLLSLVVLLFFIRYVSPFFGIKFVLLSPTTDWFDPRRLLAPTIVLSVRPLAYVSQITIGALNDIMRRDYIRIARAKGLLPFTILFRHIIRNVAQPALTGLNSSFFFSLSSILVVEWLFAWGGVGAVLLEAVTSKDAELASYLLISIGLTLLVVNTIVKVIISKVDPRLSEGETAVS